MHWLRLQGRPDVRPSVTRMVVATISKVGDNPALAKEVDAMIDYVQHMFVMRNVTAQRKKWDDDRQSKVNAAIANAMKTWDDEHYPSLLEATWGWHPFYLSFVANPLCSSFRPAYPLCHSVAEAVNVQFMVLEQSHIQRVYPVPWSVLFLRCLLKYHSLTPPLISHPFSGGTVSNVTKWLQLAEEEDGEGWRAWHLARRYLKEEGFLVFAGAREVDSRQQWHAEVDAAWLDLKNPTPDWWADLQLWCQSIQFRALQDMAFHDKQSWMKAWIIGDKPATLVRPFACYDRWLQHREDIDIGYVLSNPGNEPGLVTCDLNLPKLPI